MNEVMKMRPFATEKPVARRRLYTNERWYCSESRIG